MAANDVWGDSWGAAWSDSWADAADAPAPEVAPSTYPVGSGRAWQDGEYPRGYEGIPKDPIAEVIPKTAIAEVDPKSPIAEVDSKMPIAEVGPLPLLDSVASLEAALAAPEPLTADDVRRIAGEIADQSSVVLLADYRRALADETAARDLEAREEQKRDDAARVLATLEAEQSMQALDRLRLRALLVRLYADAV